MKIRPEQQKMILNLVKLQQNESSQIPEDSLGRKINGESLHANRTRSFFADLKRSEIKIIEKFCHFLKDNDLPVFKS